jgi:phosphoribosylformylglycinamidine synthase
MKARVTVTLKSGVLDPQGKAIEGALTSLGIRGVLGVRQGKMFEIELATDDAGEAEATLRSPARSSSPTPSSRISATTSTARRSRVAAGGGAAAALSRLRSRRKIRRSRRPGTPRCPSKGTHKEPGT